ncbi:hypothetical protein O181_032754 [Austropuccinia psidii MF-1]|uniref:Uncharacterized protein n=1 Tax=Austropuccinia psidii MF-1 TaxID=1389203 RepID=A0A9Q3CY03_9BASI|nr:hypothetical protein [Austropuccinia psidii MF-1]
MAGDELYASLPLVHKPKVTVSHPSYSSKPRTVHASSSREKIVYYEDENMTPTQSEKTGEPRRENFIKHEEGTQGNIELTHPQISLSQSMIDQSEMRQ